MGSATGHARNRLLPGDAPRDRQPASRYSRHHNRRVDERFDLAHPRTKCPGFVRDADGAVCEANYCSGCNAEWHDPSGALVCEALSTSNYDAPDRQYSSRNPDDCTRVNFLCAEGSPFFDACGCGCTAPSSEAACKVGGCSSQLCVEPADPGISTCEWRDAYACYRTAACERQLREAAAGRLRHSFRRASMLLCKVCSQRNHVTSCSAIPDLADPGLRLRRGARL